MRSLVLRQVRLLLPTAVACLALGLLCWLGTYLYVQEAFAALNVPAELVALIAVSIVAPWLLGVAAIAPDAESGALAFLGGLPVRRGRHLALRAGVALGWSAVAIAPFAVASARAHPRLSEEVLAILCVAPFVAAAAMASAAATGRSLVAFAVTPVALAVPTLLFGGWAAWLMAPEEVFLGGLLALPVALLLATWAAFRELRHPGPRPALRGAAVVMGGVALGLGATTTAYGWARFVPERAVEVAWVSDRGAVGLALSSTSGWPGKHEWQRWAFVPREALLEEPDLVSATRRGLVLEAGVQPLAFGPDGSAIVLGEDGQVALVDTAGERRGPWRSYAPNIPWTRTHVNLPGPLPSWTSPGVGWTSTGAAWLLEGRVARGFDGGVAWRLPEGVTVQAVWEQRLLVRTASGWSLLDPVSGRDEPLDVPQDSVTVERSPGGRWLVVAHGEPTDAGKRGLRPLELRPRAGGGVAISIDRPTLWTPRLTFTPDEAGVIAVRDDHERTGGYRPTLTHIDLSTGVRRAIMLDGSALLFPSVLVRAWSPSGRRLLCDLGLIDLGAPSLELRPVPSGGQILVGAFADEDTIVVATPAGALVRFPLGR